MGSANERRRYYISYVTPSLIGRGHTTDDPWIVSLNFKQILSDIRLQCKTWFDPIFLHISTQFEILNTYTPGQDKKAYATWQAFRHDYNK